MTRRDVLLVILLVLAVAASMFIISRTTGEVTEVAHVQLR